MAATPEAKVKQSVKSLFADFDHLYQYWPVPGGFGKPTLDCIGCYREFFFSVEVKAPGKKPTERQKHTIDDMQRAGGKVFVVDGPAGVAAIAKWFNSVDEFWGLVPSK